jgi:dATP pyrophosphohydrolase
MARAAFQVLVLPFTQQGDRIKYAIFTRSDAATVQFIAGGGENNEQPAEAAKREAFEEAGISPFATYYTLNTQCSIPVYCFRAADRAHWGKECFVVPEYAFAVRITSETLTLSHEHIQYEWLEYDAAAAKLRYDSNRTALWELNERIKTGCLHEAE